MAKITPSVEDIAAALSAAEDRAIELAKQEGNATPIELHRVSEQQKAIQGILPADWKVTVKQGSRGFEYVITPSKARR